MTGPAWSTLAVVVAAAALAASGRVAIDVLGAFIWLALAMLRVLPVHDLLAGFGSEAVVLVGAMMAVAEGLRRVGATRRFGDWLTRRLGPGEGPARLAFVLAGAVLAALLETTAGVLTLLPVVARLGTRRRVAPERLYLVVALGAMAGGTLTLIGTSGNLVANGILAAAGQPGFGFLEPARLGLAVVAVATLYAGTVAVRLLPRGGGEPLAGALEAFRSYVSEVRLVPGSPFADRALGESGLRDAGLEVLTIVRATGRVEDPGPGERLQPGDLLVVAGAAADVAGLAAVAGRAPLAEVAEGLVPPGSAWAGRTLADLGLRASGVHVLGIWRHGRTLAGPIRDVRLEAGDVLLARGERRALAELQEQGRVAWLGAVEVEGARSGRLLPALAVLAGFVAVAASGAVDIALAAFAAATALVLLRCLDAPAGYAAVQWPVIVLLAGVIPLGEAISRTGLAAVAAGGLAAVGHVGGPRAALAGLALAAALAAQVLSNVPATAVMTPVAVRVAAACGLSVKACVAAVLVAVLCAPLTALANKPAILVRQAGGYAHRDYLRLGLPFTAAVLALVVSLAPILWPS